MRSIHIDMVIVEFILHDLLNFHDQDLLDLLHLIQYRICILFEQKNFIMENVLYPVEVVTRMDLRLRLWLNQLHAV